MARSEVAEAAIRDLASLGLQWTMGPSAAARRNPTGRASVRGSTGPPRTTSRAALAYRCFCSQERLDALREERPAAA
jgi:glutamyl/glutaminyl-tRNA synthetase